MFPQLQLVGSLFLAATVAIQGFAGGGEPRALAGIIVRIDRAERSVIVRDLATKRETTVRIPEGKLIRLKDGSVPAHHGRLVPFEHVMLGMRVDLSVQAIEANAR